MQFTEVKQSDRICAQPVTAPLLRCFISTSFRHRTRTRVARVRAEYPDQLDYRGFCCLFDSGTSKSSQRRTPRRDAQTKTGEDGGRDRTRGPPAVSRVIDHAAAGK